MKKKLRKVELYKFEINGHTLALDVKKSRVFRIEDELTSEVIDLLNDLTPEEITNTLADRYGRKQVFEVLKEMEKAKIITGEDQKEEVSPPSPAREITALCLNVTYDCNLRCKYCYYNDGNPFHGSKIHMSENVAKKAVDFLIKESEDKKNLLIDFFGGEPLLKFDLIKTVVKYAKVKAQQANKRVAFGITTNGTLLTKNVAKYLAENKIGVQISIDGNRVMHNRARVFRNGKGSYDRVILNARNLIPKGSPFARITVTHQDLQFMKAVKHLLHQGFNGVSVAPASGINRIWAINGDDFKQLEQEHDEAAKYFLEKMLKHHEFVPFYNFTLPLRIIYFRKKQRYPCGAGLFYLAVSPEGDLYPCHRFVGIKKFFLGNLSSPFKNNRRALFLNNYVESKADCRQCWARYLCGGQCPYWATETNGDIRRPNEGYCELQQYILKLSLMIFSQIHQKDKAIIEKLFDPRHQPYMLNPDLEKTENNTEGLSSDQEETTNR